MPGKGGRLTETVTEEMLESSKTVLQSYRGRGSFGCQQYFSPPESAQLIHAVFGEKPVVDLTAGDGALLTPFDLENRLGIEIDPDYKDSAFDCITADIQKVYPLLRQIGFKADAFALNPPWGLRWNDEKYGSNINSAVLTYLYCLELMSPWSQGVLIAGTNRFRRELLTRDEGKHFYAIIECPDLFDDADISSVIAFFTNKEATDCAEMKCLDREDLPGYAPAVINARNKNAERFWSPSHYRKEDMELLHGMWDSVRKEYERRYSANKKVRKYTLSVKNGRISAYPSAFEQQALGYWQVDNLKGINNQTVNYFALNRAAWDGMKNLAAEGSITIDPMLEDAVAVVLKEAKKKICPLYPIKPQQRLGFLKDADQLECIKSDEERGYVAGLHYTVYVQSQVLSAEYVDVKETIDGDLKEKPKRKEWKVLNITVDKHEFTETKEDIEYLMEHFDLPDPGDLASNYPEETSKMIDLLESLESHGVEDRQDWSFRNFQKEDLARLLMKEGGLLAWEQGLGKTLGGLAFVEAAIKLGAKDKALFIVPQDLVPQWQREAEKFFGRKLTVIKHVGHARQAKKHLEAGGTGWYITYYEAISRNGRKRELLPPVTFTVKGEYGREVEHDSTEFCPGCDEPAQRGEWNPKGGICYKCGYKHRKLFVKPAYTHLTNCFKKGVIIIDEGTKMKSNTSLTSLSIRGLKAEYRLLLTGTPIKNYINDAFWLLWWALRDNSVKFPFSYQGGYNLFLKEFAVVEYNLDSYGSKEGRPRVLPEVTNLSMLWRLLCCSIIRRRKEETGEPIVARRFVPVYCPIGTEQLKMYRDWLDGFTDFYTDKYPDKPISKFPAMVDRNAAILGQLWKLEYTTILPESEPDGFWDRGSNWTPSNLKVLKLATQHAAAGDKILIGSSLKGYGPWIAEQLNNHGVTAIHITETSKDGVLSTKSPKKRAGVVKDFCFNGTSVLAATTQSMMLGHNMDAANVVIIHGLPWDHSSFSQFIARVHRLTSERDVTVYIVMTTGTVDDRKWELIQQKGAAADLAIDGELSQQHEEPVNLQTILDELRQQGIKGDGAIPESLLYKQWNRPPAMKHTNQLSLLAM